jgi:hypothetical protein
LASSLPFRCGTGRAAIGGRQMLYGVLFSWVCQGSFGVARGGRPAYDCVLGVIDIACQ